MLSESLTFLGPLVVNCILENCSSFNILYSLLGRVCLLMHSPSLKRSSHKEVEKAQWTENFRLGGRIANRRRRSSTRGFPLSPHPAWSLFGFSAGAALPAMGPAGCAALWRRAARKLQPGSAGWARRGAALRGRGPALLAGPGPGTVRDGVGGWPAGFGGPDQSGAVGIRGGPTDCGPVPGSVIDRGAKVPWGPGEDPGAVPGAQLGSLPGGTQAAAGGRGLVGRGGWTESHARPAPPRPRGSGSAAAPGPLLT